MTCPICERLTVHDYRPFCSQRCADVDLGRWMTGAYRVPEPLDADDEDASDAHSRGSSGDGPR
ncbi:MAG: DNA gyrase inhibitor YacG [Pseudomonadota bacterium]